MSRRAVRTLLAATAATLHAACICACTLAFGDEELQSGECPEGTKACDEECVPINRANLGCAREGCAPCSIPHAVAICSAEGECAIGTCQNDYRDCDPSKQGCETDTNHDPDNCGDCGVVCPDAASAIRGCTAGSCAVAGCDPGFKDCNKKYSDGCEIDVGSDAANCGDCGVPCTLPMTCVDGACQ
jgi:hypothetical protein